MATRPRALSHAENQIGQPAQALKARALQPARAALGSINLNTRHASASDALPNAKDVLKPAKLVRRVAPEDEEESKMDTSAVRGAEAELEEMIDDAVENIDAEDVRNPQLVTEYVNEIYSYLRFMERRQAVKNDYLSGQTEILPKMRGVLVDWLVGVHLQFHLLQETLYTTVAIMDRFLQNEVKSITRKKLQLVGVASMLIAAKYEEIYAPEVKDFVYITDRAYTEKEILRMEVRVLAALQFDLGRPLPLHFLRRASKAGGVDATTHTLAKYIVELSLGVYSLCPEAPSKVAAAALALAMRLLIPGSHLSTVWGACLEHYTKFTIADLTPMVATLAEALFLAPTAKLSTVYTKYTNKKFMKISRIPALDDPVLRRLAKGEVL